VRIAAWIFVACTLVCGLSIFVPSVEVQIGRVALSKRTSVSLWQASTNTAVAKRVVAAFNGNSKRRLGEAVTAALLPYVKGSAHGHLDDAHSALESVDVTDSDIDTGGRVLEILLLGFLALGGVAIGLVFAELMRPEIRRKRVAIALAVSVLIAALSIGFHLVCREGVWQANDSLGKDAFGLATGAWLMPVMGVGALGALIAVLVIQRRRQKSVPAA
jgi:hypothetical protein